MNVIFLDFDGVLNTTHYSSDVDIEKRIKLLSIICKKYDSKIVIESSHKDHIDEETLLTDSRYVKFIFDCFKKYNIDCIGRTKTVDRKKGAAILPMWKEDEIILYLNNHPEIDHFCIIDDDDRGPRNSDLDKLRNHLVITLDYSKNPLEEGLLEQHIEEVGKILTLDNEFKKIVSKQR